MFSKVKEMSQITAKRSAEEAQLTANSVMEKKSKPAKGPWMPVEFDHNGDSASIAVKKNNSGELMPEVRVKGDEDSTMAVQFNTPCMTVKFSDLGPGGTYKPGNDKSYGTADNYHYTVKTVAGLPDKVSAAMPKEEERQQAFLTWSDSVCNALLEKAFETAGCMEKDKKKAAKMAKKNKTDAKTEFMNGANKSMFKEHTDKETDQDIDLYVSKRRGLTTDGKSDKKVDNRPVFWKRTRAGFEKMEDVKYISQGSVLKYQVGFRMYSSSLGYGVSCSLGKNIVVIYQKNNPSGASSSSSNEPNVPYIEF